MEKFRRRHKKPGESSKESKKTSKSQKKQQRQKERLQKRAKQKRKKTKRSRVQREIREKKGRRSNKNLMNEQEKEHMSMLYSRKAVEVIEKASHKKPLFLYLSLFTKSYPRRVGKVKSRQKHMERFRQKNLRELDSSLAGVVQALKTSRRLDNSVIIFISDNGAREWSDPSLPNHNAPLRGAKGSVYEGGTKVPAVIHSPTLLSGGRR